MAKAKTLIELLDQLAPSLRAAFMQSIANLQSDVQIKLLEAAVKSGSVDQVLRVLNLGAEYFRPLDRALAAAYSAGGDWAIADMIRDAHAKGVQVRARFNDRNPRVEEYLASRSSDLITGNITDTARQTVRNLLEAGNMAGRGPRSIALDIVGRIDLATGKRVGGVIGLTDGDRIVRDRALAELRSGDPAQLRKYLKRKTRDRRMDAAVRAAIRSETPVPANVASKMINRMEARLLKVRGDRIARTELISALNHAANEGLEQMIDAGKLTAQQIVNEWDAANDKDTRPSHRAMDGQRRNQGSTFLSGDGNALKYPGDRSSGAPASDVINCRCRLIRRIDWIAGLKPGD